MTTKLGRAHWEGEVAVRRAMTKHSAFASGDATFLNARRTQVGTRAAEIKVLSPPAASY